MFTVNLPSANASAIRADGYSTRVYASFFKHKIVAQGTIVAPTYPQAGQNPIIIVNAYTTGAYTDLEYGMEVVFTDASGNFKGRTYIREAEISAPVFQIPEYAQAKLNLDTGDIFTVYDEFRLHAKIVGARASFPPDLLEHTDEGSNPPPRILTGGAWAGRVDAGQTYASVPFDYTGSRNTDPDSTPTDVSFTTRTQTGVAVDGAYSATDDQIVMRVTASATAYTVTVEGEDTDNSKVTLRRTPVMVHDDSNPPHEVVITAYDGTQENGFNFSIEVVDGAVDIDTIPEGCLCVLWTDERYADAEAAYRNRAPGREHIIGVGYIRRETLAGDGETGVSTTTFEVESYLSLLKQMTSYSKVMEENATPDAWSEVKTLGVIRAAIQLPMFYSNLLEVADVYVDSDVYNPRYPAFYLQRSNFYDQLKELLDGVDAVMSCDRAGRISIHPFQPLVPLADRSGWDVHWLFDADEVRSHELTRSHFDPVEQMKTSGFTGGTSGNVPLFSLYPGHAPGTGVDAPTRDRLIVVDQPDLNERTGRYGALADDVYMDANGVKWRAFELRLTLRGGYNFLDFGKHFYSFTESLRGLTRIADLTEFLFYLTAVSWTAGDNGEGETQATFRVATNAAAGETYTPPPDTSIPWTPLPISPPITLPDLFPGSIGRGVNRMATINVNGVSLTTDFQSLSPTWGALVKNWSGTLLQWVPNGFDPGKGWVITSTGIYYLTLSTGAATLKHTFAVASSNRSADASIAEQNFLVVASFDSTQGTTAVYTTNNSTFTQVVVNATNSANQPGCYVSPKTAGKVVIGAATGSATTAAYVSTNHGASWSTLTPGFISSVIGFMHIAAPFKNNSSDNIYYYSQAISTSVGDHRFYRYTGGTNTQIAPTYGGDPYMPYAPRNTIEVSVLNENRMLITGRKAEVGGPTVGVWLTNNARAASPTWILVDAPGGNYRRCALAGDDPNTGWCWGVSGAISQLTISGSTTTLSSRTGNLASLTPGETIAIAGW